MRMRPIFAIVSGAVILLGLALVLLCTEAEGTGYEDIQRRAALRMESAEAYLKGKILERGIAIEDEDVNGTALIGPEFTELTSTPGEIGAKRSALNPAFSAAMVRYYDKAGLRRGDTIAVGSSGSFPGLMIAVLTSATEFGLKAKVIASLGASMHGATRVDFNVFDILLGLRESGLADFELVGLSCGGSNDNGGGVGEGLLYTGSVQLSMDICRAVSERTGTTFIYEESLARNIQRRMALYGDGIRLFVNIGGASTNSGKSSRTLDFPHGLVTGGLGIPDDATRGLNYEYLSQGVPVLNLLSVKLLCRENNIPFDPIPMPRAEEVSTIGSIEYNKALIVMTMLSAALVLAVGILDGKGGFKRSAKALSVIATAVLAATVLAFAINLCPPLEELLHEVTGWS